MPSTTLTIAGVAYTNAGRPAARIRPDALELSFDGGFDSFAFSEIGGHPIPSWGEGDAVEVTWTRDDLTSRLVFAGAISDVSHTPTPDGWVIGYRALSLRHGADHVPVTNYDRTGVMSFNRSPEDPYYTPSESGLTLGDIFTLVLTVPETAAALDAAGVGAYTSLSPVTLPAETVADLAALDVVPATEVLFQGEGLISQLEQALQHWMPSRAMRVRADGTIRVLDTRDVGASGAFVPVDVSLPNAVDGGDPISWPSLHRSTARCATRVLIRGSAEVEGAILSTEDGTLTPVWTPTEEGDWTYSDFTEPKDAYSEGAVTSMTGNSAVLDPDDVTRAWGANFWSGREATLFLYAPLATGLTMTLSRAVTANAALTAGGTASVTWDAGWPADSTGYTRYRLIGGAGGLADVGRLYAVREPATGDTGLDTLIGSHLVRRSPLPVRVAHAGGWIANFFPSGWVCWSLSGNPPFHEWPVPVEAIPTQGRFRFPMPVVAHFGDQADLAIDYPTTHAGGVPGDVRVIAFYSRGTLEAVAPADTGSTPNYEGTAFTADGIERTKVIDLPAWSNRGDHARLLELAQVHLDALKDVVYEGQFEWYGEPPWDWWEAGTALNFLAPPHADFWEAMNAPVRSVRLSWPQGEGVLHKFAIGFSNRRRPHSGDDLYLPAAFSYQEVDVTAWLDQSRTFAPQALPIGDLGDVGGFSALHGTLTSGFAGASDASAAGFSGMMDASAAGFAGAADTGPGILHAGALDAVAPGTIGGRSEAGGFRPKGDAFEAARGDAEAAQAARDEADRRHTQMVADAWKPEDE